MNVVFRADASHDIGSGHIMRCLTLADHFSILDADILFICRYLPDALYKLIRHRGYQIKLLGPEYDNQGINVNIETTLSHVQFTPSPYDKWLDISWEIDANNTANILIALGKTDVLIVDSYSIDLRWEHAISPYVNSLIVIDDLINRNHYCSILIDQTLGRSTSDYAQLVPDFCQLFLSVDFSILRPEFSSFREISLSRRNSIQKINSILINFGGSDPDSITLKILRLIADTKFDISLRLDIVIGSDTEHFDSIKKLSAKLPYQTEIHSNIQNMAQLLSKTDLVIGASGTAAWERCCLGIPSLLIVCAKNQIDNAEALKAFDAAIILAYSTDMSAIDKKYFFESVIDNNMWQKVSTAASRLCDGRGANRLINFMVPRRAKDKGLVHCRPAVLEDKDVIYQWQLAPETRKHSRNPNPPKYEQHVSWFKNKLKDTSSFFNILLHNSEPAGVVRLDLINKVFALELGLDENEEKAYEVSIYMNPEKYCLGLGAIGLSMVESLVPRALLIAYVSETNSASINLFKNSGYEQIKNNIYTRQLN